MTEADEYGLALLTLWHRMGAQIVARSEEARAIAEPILRQPTERGVPQRGWFRRLFGLLLQDGAETAAFPACAGAAGQASLRDENGRAESMGLGDLGHVESGLP